MDGCPLKSVFCIYGDAGGLNPNVYFFDKFLIINSLNNHFTEAGTQNWHKKSRGFYFGVLGGEEGAVRACLYARMRATQKEEELVRSNKIKNTFFNAENFCLKSV